MTTTINLRLKLIDDLFRETPERNRCPYIRRDEKSPYCSKNLEGNKISETRRTVCDPTSLQFWCLNKVKAPACIYYQGEPLE